MADLDPKLKNAIAGVAQAVSATFVGYPFDLIKARLQTGLYGQSTIDCVKHTWRSEGVFAFYRGVAAPLLSHTVKRPFQYPLAEWLKTQDFSGRWWSNYWVGGVTGLVGPIFGTPLQNIKVCMQSTTRATTDVALDNSLGAAIFLWRTYGPAGFYRGFRATLLKDCLFGASFLGHYYTLRDWWGHDTVVKNAAAGATAHCLTWMVLIPIDNVKTMVQRPDNTQTATQIVTHTLRHRGPAALWAGVVPSCARTLPMSAVAMTCYEATRKALGVED